MVKITACRHRTQRLFVSLPPQLPCISLGSPVLLLGCKSTFLSLAVIFGSDTSCSFALDACLRRYHNRQHSLAQLAAGCILGTINCGLTGLALHSNGAAVTHLDGFLKSTHGKFDGIRTDFLLWLLMFVLGAGLSAFLACAAGYVVFEKELQRCWVRF